MPAWKRNGRSLARPTPTRWNERRLERRRAARAAASTGVARDSRASARTRSWSRRGGARARCSVCSRPVGRLVERAVAGEHRDDVEAVVGRGRARAASACPRRDVSATSTSCSAPRILRMLARLRAVTDDAVALTSRSTRTGREGIGRPLVGSESVPAVRARDLDALATRDRRVPGVPAARRVARAGRAREAGVVPRRGRTGARPVPGLRRPARPRAASSASRRPRTAGTAPAACSPATARATSSSRRCTAPASRTSRRRSRSTTGCELHDAYVAAAVRCAPPANKPTPAERDECAPYLRRELELLDRVRVIVALGAFGYEAVWAALRASRRPASTLPGPAAEVRARARGAVRSRRPCSALPPEPAEHVHRQAHARRCSTRCSRAPRELS